MTPVEALEILRRCWGHPGIVTQQDHIRISLSAEPGETELGTVLRCTGIKATELAPFDFDTVLRVCAEREKNLK